MKPIHELLRDMREDRDIKQYVIAEMLGMSQQQYSRYETGESELPLRALSVLADYYSVSADYLMGRKDFLYGVPGLDKKVTAERTAGEVLNDLLSLGAEGRAFVIECIYLQKLKQSCEKKKERNDPRL